MLRLEGVCFASIGPHSEPDMVFWGLFEEGGGDADAQATIGTGDEDAAGHEGLNAGQGGGDGSLAGVLAMHLLKGHVRLLPEGLAG